MTGKLNGKDGSTVWSQLPEVINPPTVKEVLAAPRPFGAIDAIAPGQRLAVLIDAARTFRSQYPCEPKRATELAVDEILLLREREARHTKEFTKLLRDLEKLSAEKRAAQRAVQIQRDRQFKSRWFRIGLRLGLYY